MKKVLIELGTGRLCDIVPPGTEFPVSAGLQWVDAPENVAHDTHFWNGKAVALIPPRPLPEVKAEKLAELQRARDQAAAANVTVHGKVFSADPKITDLFAKLADRKRRGKPSALTAIFDVNGSPVPPNPTTLEAIEDAIAAQVEDAWNKYGTLVEQVMAATNNTQVEAITW